MSTLPPPKAAGWSALNAFWMEMDLTISAGNRSIGMTLRVRSGEGTKAPFTVVLEYRSPSPRM